MYYNLVAFTRLEVFFLILAKMLLRGRSAVQAESSMA